MSAPEPADIKHAPSSRALSADGSVVQQLNARPLPQTASRRKEERGAAFHEKSAKNSKVNFIVRKKDRMMKKYGKPKQ